MSYIEKKRERRIRDRERVKAKARSIYRIQMGGSYVPDCGRHREALERWNKHADYLAVCSCSMCGNPRRWFGHKTLQELRFLQS